MSAPVLISSGSHTFRDRLLYVKASKKMVSENKKGEHKLARVRVPVLH